MGINQVSQVLGRVTKVVSFFHRNTTAAAVLQDERDWPRNEVLFFYCRLVFREGLFIYF